MTPCAGVSVMADSAAMSWAGVIEIAGSPHAGVGAAHAPDARGSPT